VLNAQHVHSSLYFVKLLTRNHITCNYRSRNVIIMRSYCDRSLFIAAYVCFILITLASLIYSLVTFLSDNHTQKISCIYSMLWLVFFFFAKSEKLIIKVMKFVHTDISSLPPLSNSNSKMNHTFHTSPAANRETVQKRPSPNVQHLSDLSFTHCKSVLQHCVAIERSVGRIPVRLPRKMFFTTFLRRRLR
jgi:hypothetical protein